MNAAAAAKEIREAVEVFDGERVSLSAIENLRRTVLEVADGLAPANVMPLRAEAWSVRA